MKKTSENERGILFSALKAQIVWLASGAILLLFFCGIAYSTADPGAVIVPLSLAALYLSSAIGGISSARHSENPFLSGALCGVITALAVLIMSFIPIYRSESDTWMTLLLNALVIPASLLGALVGKPRAKSAKSAKKHRAKIKKMRK